MVRLLCLTSFTKWQLWHLCRYRLGRAKSPDGQKSSDEEEDKSTSSSAAAQKKTTSPAAGAGTGKTSSSSASSTDCKNNSADSCDKKTACDKGLVKSETGASKNCSVQQKKDVDDSQQTDEGQRKLTYLLLHPVMWRPERCCCWSRV